MRVATTHGKVIVTGNINGDYHVEATEDHFEITILMELTNIFIK